jgi:hypothetical protein
VLNEAVRLKRGGAYAVNALLIALITAVRIICVFGCLPLPLDLPSLGSSFLYCSACAWLQLDQSENRKRCKSATTHALSNTHLCHNSLVLQEVDLG